MLSQAEHDKLWMLRCGLLVCHPELDSGSHW